MFYRHWKKIALALTGFFWVGCEDSVSSEECLYGTPTDYISSESEGDDGLSSSSAKGSSSETANSSSSKQKSISSSSGGEEPQGIVACYDVSSDRQTLVRQQNNGITFLSCDDGTTCQEKVIPADVTAPDCEATDCDSWEPLTVLDTVYYCINGENSKIYTPEEFKERYAKADEDADDSSGSFDAPVAVYGPPCYFSGTCDTEEDK